MQDTDQNPDENAGDDAMQNSDDNVTPIDEFGVDMAAAGDVAALQLQVTELQNEMAAQKDRMMRALAEAENTRKRALKDREDAIKFASAGFARDLLDFADNFNRALDAIPDDIKEGDDVRLQNVLSGLDAMERELSSVFEKNKIKKIKPLDEPFDPNFHEVMYEAPVPGKAAGIIIEVIEPGYVLHDRLLRPARVGIAKAGEDGGQTPPDAGTNVDTQA